MARIVAGLILGVWLCGCYGGQAEAACDSVAPEWRGSTVAAFNTNLAGVRNLLPQRQLPSPIEDQPDDSPAVLCYIDGDMGKSPPDGEPFDRVVVAIVSGKAEVLVMGYRDQLDVIRP